ncbi:MAG: hypothetical protein ABJP34_09580 [Erythrobacter sp.]
MKSSITTESGPIEPSTETEAVWRSSDHGIYLLFTEGKRPDRRAILDFIEDLPSSSLTYDPVAGSPLSIVKDSGNGAALTRSRSTEGVWIELLRDGLTFDLEGFAPASALDLPRIEHRFDFDVARALGAYESLRLIPGEHLSGGEGTMPVVRCLVSLARDLAIAFPELVAVVWPPAKSIIGSQFFESTATAWLDGGAFPALGLTSFVELVEGGVQTLGLSYFIGQELRIPPPIGNQKTEATRLGIRLVNQLVLVGGIGTSERLTAPDGSRLVLSPTRGGKLIDVTSE